MLATNSTRNDEMREDEIPNTTYPAQVSSQASSSGRSNSKSAMLGTTKSGGLQTIRGPADLGKTATSNPSLQVPFSDNAQ